MVHKIGVDIDGVLLSIAPQIAKMSKERFQVEIGINSHTDWDLTKCTSLTSEQVKELLNSEDLYIGAIPSILARNELDTLCKKWQIHVVTSRPTKFYPLTYLWLKDNGFKFHHLSFSYKKEIYARENNLKFFVEDNYDTASHLSSRCIVFLLDKLYNRGRDMKNVIRVSSWREISSYLSKI